MIRYFFLTTETIDGTRSYDRNVLFSRDTDSDLTPKDVGASYVNDLYVSEADEQGYHWCEEGETMTRLGFCKELTKYEFDLMNKIMSFTPTF